MFVDMDQLGPRRGVGRGPKQQVPWQAWVSGSEKGLTEGVWPPVLAAVLPSTALPWNSRLVGRHSPVS
jgi:hypothetical protein